MRKLVATIAALLILLGGVRAAADPEPMPSGHMRLMTSPGVLRMLENGREFSIPKASHVYDEPTWLALDAELRRLQDQENRLAAENKSLRKTADQWRPGWRSLAAAALLGLGLGVYAHWKLD